MAYQKKQNEVTACSGNLGTVDMSMLRHGTRHQGEICYNYSWAGLVFWTWSVTVPVTYMYLCVSFPLQH